jgi:hypothetical protein
MSAILGAHPEIAVLNYESYFFYRPPVWKNTKLNSHFRLLNFGLRLIKQGIPNGKKYWCEKTPRNVLNLDNILVEFNSSVKVILMVRNYIDVLTSRHPQKDGYYISIERWKEDTTATLKFKQHPQVLIVPYEGIVTDFDFTLGKVCNFLNVPFVDEVRDFALRTSVKQHQAFHGGSIREIYKTSLDRSKDPIHTERIDEIMESQELQQLSKQVEEVSQSFFS